MQLIRGFIWVMAGILPGFFRRALLKFMLGHEIAPSAKVSRFTVIMARKLVARESAWIGPLTLCKGLDYVEVEEYGWIGALNWITAFPLYTQSEHFKIDKNRKTQLLVGKHAAITNRHIIDCTDTVKIGAYTTIAGYRSQILTHSINLHESKQRCRSIEIGEYCFIGTGCTLLGGCYLPNRSVLMAQSLLNKAQVSENYLYGGVPARPLKPISDKAEYFNRTVGYVD